MPPTIRQIQTIVAADYGVSVMDIISRRQSPRAIRPRHVAMWLARHSTCHSYPTIGRAFERDHTTVMSAIDRIDDAREADHEFAERLLRLWIAVNHEDRAPKLRLVA